MSDAYEQVPWRGVTMEKITVASLTLVEQRLGRPIDTVYQGSYNRGTGASAGTHDEGGAIDCYDRDPNGLCKLMRQVGCWAAWIRNPSQGDWPWHIHGILVGHDHLAPLAADQVEMYRAGYNGLGWYDYADDFGYRPDPIKAFDYAAYLHNLEDHVDSNDLERIGNVIENKLKPLTKAMQTLRTNNRRRHAEILAAIDGLPDGDLTRADVRAAVSKVLAKDDDTTP